MRILDHEHVARRLDYRALIRALRSGFAGMDSSATRTRLETGADGDSKLLLIKPAWDDEITIIKVLTLNEQNRRAGLPFIQGLIVLFDKATGTPVGVMDAEELTLRRTAAASALAADFLAVPDAGTLTLIGTGALAPHMALAHAEIRPLRRVIVIGRRIDKAEATAKAINRANPALNARAARDPSKAVGEAHIVCAATSSRTPVLRGNWIAQGTHVDLVGAFSPNAREADDRTIARARVFVDDRASVLKEAGDLMTPIANGTISESHIVGDLAQLCSGEVEGRTSREEITLFKSVGVALEDLVATKLVIGSDTGSGIGSDVGSESMPIS